LSCRPVEPERSAGVNPLEAEARQTLQPSSNTRAIDPWRLAIQSPQSLGVIGISPFSLFPHVRQIGSRRSDFPAPAPTSAESCQPWSASLPQKPCFSAQILS
jgi:hypothetical protein